MNPDEFVVLNNSGLPIIGQGELSEFDASANAGLFVYAPRWPLLASAPATVVDGQSWRIAEAGQDYGREYLGVAGAWVPQASVTTAMWVWDGTEWVIIGIDYVLLDGELVFENGKEVVYGDLVW